MLRWRDSCTAARRPRQVLPRSVPRRDQLRTAMLSTGFWAGLVGDRECWIASNRNPVSRWQRDPTLRPGRNRASTGTPRHLPPSNLSRPPAGPKCPGRLRTQMLNPTRSSPETPRSPLASLPGSPSRPSRRSVHPLRSLRTLRPPASPRCRPSRRAWALVRTTRSGRAPVFPPLNLRGKPRSREPTGALPPAGHRLA